jgi:endonuclease/exonuclease/phosphatase family metal-dependent hydrolase
MRTLFALLRDAWAVRNSAPGFTSPASPRRDAARRIDYIFVTRDLTVSSVEVPVNRETRMGSDHYPVFAEIQLPQ